MPLVSLSGDSMSMTPQTVGELKLLVAARQGLELSCHRKRITILKESGSKPEPQKDEELLDLDASYRYIDQGESRSIDEFVDVQVLIPWDPYGKKPEDKGPLSSIAKGKLVIEEVDHVPANDIAACFRCIERFASEIGGITLKLQGENESSMLLSHCPNMSAEVGEDQQRVVLEIQQDELGKSPAALEISESVNSPSNGYCNRLRLQFPTKDEANRFKAVMKRCIEPARKRRRHDLRGDFESQFTRHSEG